MTQFLTKWASATALAVGVSLAATAPSVAQEGNLTTPCEDEPAFALHPYGDALTPANRWAIMEVLAGYARYFDSQNAGAIAGLFTDAPDFKICRGAEENTERFATDPERLAALLDQIFSQGISGEAKAQHFITNVTLHPLGEGEAEFDASMLVTIQWTGWDVPLTDYTAVMRGRIIRVDPRKDPDVVGGEWKIKEHTTWTREPVMAQARAR